MHAEKRSSENFKRLRKLRKGVFPKQTLYLLISNGELMILSLMPIDMLVSSESFRHKITKYTCGNQTTKE